MTEKDTCVMCQLYFYVNLFNSLEDSSIVKVKIINKKTREKLLNEKFSIDKHENENRT